jgi:hypothetical protein
MHANYLYLMDGNDGSVDEPADLVRNWESAYGRILDENNWYSPVAAFWHGQSYECDSDNGDVFQKSDELPTFEDWLKSAMIIAAYELHLHGANGLFLSNDADKKIEEMSTDEILSDIRTEIPRVLSEMFSRAVGEEPRTGYERERYERDSMARGYGLFMFSNVPPFTRYDHPSPYHWRTVDLRTDHSGEFDPKTDAILMLDIHT